MRHLILFLFFFTASAQQHCGFDFTSFLVLHVHEEGKKENIPGLRLTLVDSFGSDVINLNSRYSWNNANEILVFKENYLLKTEENLAKPVSEAKWLFPFAKDVYFLSVTNDFPTEELKVRVADPNGKYETEEIELQPYNLYMLCSSKAVQFGKRSNKPVEVVLRKK